MFLFSVSRRGGSRPAEVAGATRFAFGDWEVCALVDDWLSSSELTAGGPVVRERAPLGAGGDALTLVEARFTSGGPSEPTRVELFKSLVGGRQVYYHLGPDGSLHCASHVRLLRDAGVRLEDDPDRLPELFLYRYVTPPRTLFKGIDQLLAGQRLRFEFDGGRWRLVADDRYVPPVPSADAADHPQGHDGRYGTYGERNAAALRESIAAMAPSLRPPHVLLSGGLDSSILFKLAGDELGVRDSYSTSYPFPSQREPEDVERAYALSASEAMGARHEFFAPTLTQYVRGVVEAVAAAEEPVVHLQSVLMMLLFRDGLPRGNGSVVVGQGADGAYGLTLHAKVRRLEARARKYEPWQPILSFGPALGTLRLASKTVGRAGGLVEAMRMRFRPDEPVDDPRHVLWWLGGVGDPRWIRRRLGATVEDANATRAALMRSYQGRSANDLISVLDFLGDVSVTQSIWSKMGEAAGKWVYYPFNWPGLMDAAFETPWDVKLAEPKGLLRGVARRVGVPEFIITRPKANFNAVPTAWAVRGGIFEPLVRLTTGVFEQKAIRKAQAEEWPKAYTFWTMLNYAIWKRLFILKESPEALLDEIAGSTDSMAGRQVALA